MLKVGDRLGRFELREELGRGSHGVVFEAVDVLLGEKVAVKALQPFMSGDPTLRERFKRELVLTRRVSHPGVARLHDLHDEDGTLFISMQFIEGKSLSQAIRAGIGGDDRVIHILRGTASALAAAHQEGVIHRDLKPANIMLADGGKDRPERVVVLDFGIATATGVGQLTRPGEAMGSVPYVPPEVWAGEPASPKGDQYSLGVTAFVMLTKELPYSGKSPLEVLDAIRSTTATIRERAADVDLELEAVILKAMAKKPDERFNTIGDLELALARIAERRKSGGKAPATPEEARALLGPMTPVPVVMAPAPSKELNLDDALLSELAPPPSSTVSQSLRPVQAPQEMQGLDDPTDRARAAQIVSGVSELADPLSIESAAVMLMPETHETGEVIRPNDSFTFAPSTNPGGRPRDDHTLLEDDAVHDGDDRAGWEKTAIIAGALVDVTVPVAKATKSPPPTTIAAIAAGVVVVIIIGVVAITPSTLMVGPLTRASSTETEDPAQPVPVVAVDPQPPPVVQHNDPPDDDANDIDWPEPEPLPPLDSRDPRPKAHASTAALDAIVKDAAKRGFRPGDIPAMDQALAAGRKEAKTNDKPGVEKQALRAKAALDGAKIDKAFVSDKLARFNKAYDGIKDDKAKEALKPVAKDVLVRISQSKWAEANQRLNDAFVLIAKAKKR